MPILNQKQLNAIANQSFISDNLQKSYGVADKADSDYHIKSDTNRDGVNGIDSGKASRLPNENQDTGYTYRAPFSDEEKSLQDYISQNQAPSKADIFKQNRELAQGQIDYINQQFDKAISDTQDQGKEALARTRALNVSGGLSGSSFASAARGETQGNIDKAVAQQNAARQGQISDILSGVDQRSSDEFLKRKDAYLAQAGDNLDRISAFQDKVQNQAKSDLGAIAATGVGLKEFQDENPQAYNQILGELGGDDNILKGYFLAGKPADTKIGEESVGNKKIYIYRDPVSGKITTESVDLPVDDASMFKTVQVGDNLAFVPIDASGNVDLSRLDQFKTLYAGDSKMRAAQINAENALADQRRESGDTSGGLSDNQVKQIKQQLDGTRGTDGWVDPTAYENLYNTWISPSNGGTTESFLKEFDPKNYVNPANTWIPDILRPKSSSSASPNYGSLF